MNKTKKETLDRFKKFCGKMEKAGRVLFLRFSRKTRSSSSPRFSLRDQSLFAKRLSILSQSGISLLESINILKKQSGKARRKILEEMANDISNGQFLSKSLCKHRKIFGDFAINIIKVGETSGTLSENLKYLSEEIDKRRKLRGTVASAFAYPIIIMIASAGICGFLILYLFPKIMPIFKSLRMSLPIATRIMISTSSNLIKYGLWIVAGSVLIGAGLLASLRDRRVRLFFDHAIMRIPIAGLIIQHYHLANLCRTLGLLLKSDIQVLEAVKITGDASTSLPYRMEFHNIKNAVAKGSSISSHLGKNTRLFPSMVTEMISVGERTGNLPETLAYVAGIFEQELNEKTKSLSSVIEPSMMLGMGLVVGFIAISIITPIYEITQHLQSK